MIIGIKTVKNVITHEPTWFTTGSSWIGLKKL